MARSYDEASATRRARLPVETQRDGAVFGQTYRLALQVMERRELLGLTQTELAEETGIDQGDISRIERGLNFPNEKTLLLFADALGANPNRSRGRLRIGRHSRLRPVGEIAGRFR